MGQCNFIPNNFTFHLSKTSPSQGQKSSNNLLYLNIWNFSDPIVEVNAVVRHFRHPWVLIRKIWQ